MIRLTDEQWERIRDHSPGETRKRHENRGDLVSTHAASHHEVRLVQLSEGFSHFVTSIAAPVASGWSVRRVGFAPTGKRRLVTAHGRSGRQPAALMADLVRHRVAVIATPGSSGSGLSQLADQFIPTTPPWKRVL
jgi:hypothetical protein